MKKISHYNVKRFIDLYNKNYSLYKISKETGFNPKSIKKYLLENNIAIRKTKYDFSDRKKRKFLNSEKIIELYVNKNKNINQISKSLNTTRDIIIY